MLDLQPISVYVSIRELVLEKQFPREAISKGFLFA